MTSPERPRSYHHGNLRAALLEAAVAELHDTPAEQLSLRAIARSVGVSQTAPYRHFSDKEALLAAMATSGYRHLLADLEAALRESGPSASSQLRALARAYVDYAARNERLFKLMFGPLVQPADYEELRQVSRRTLGLVQQILELGMRRGEFRPQDVTYLANAAWAGIHGVATLRIDAPSLFKRHVDLARQIGLAVDTFLAGIAPGAQPEPGDNARPGAAAACADAEGSPERSEDSPETAESSIGTAEGSSGKAASPMETAEGSIETAEGAEEPAGDYARSAGRPVKAP